MSKVLKNIIYLVLIGSILIGCQLNETNDDLFQYEDSYVGDNSAVSSIISQLKNNDQFDGLELKTTEEPYGIVLNYQQLGSEQEQKETAVYNASFLLKLIHNAHWVELNFGDDQYKISKRDLQDWYGIKFAEVSSKNELELMIENHLSQ